MNEINVNGQPSTNMVRSRRFPGVTSFEDDELASELFFGREEESQKLLHYILAENLVVIFSYSGYGKTSLLKASVFKRLREKSFYPILIRFNKKEYKPQELIRLEMDFINEDESFEVLHKSAHHAISTGNILVQYLKNLEIWSNDDKLLTPVIVFDQFEEIFTLEHNQQYISSFFQDLALVLMACKEGELNVKMVISIREDFLGHLEKMATNIPSVFTNRFRLEPLKKEPAKKAIVEPARKTIANVDFASTPFSFSEDAVKELENFLSLKMIEGNWKESDDIEPIQLQIICSELENKVIRGDIKAGTNGHIEIKTTDFGGKEGLQKIVGNFYDQQIANVKQELKLTDKEVYAVKDVIETGLIAGIRRVPLSYDTVVSRPAVNKNAIDLLIKNKLLKLESLRGNSLLELSHDTLVAPVLKSGIRSKEEKERIRRKRKVIRFSLLFIFVLMLAIYVIYSIVSSQRASQDKYYYAALMASRENPTLGYKIASDGEAIGSTTTKLQSLLSQFRNGNYGFITNNFNFPDKVVLAILSKDKKEIAILGENEKLVWDMNGSLKMHSFNTENKVFIYNTNEKYFTIGMTDSCFNLRDEKNTVVNSYPIDEMTKNVMDENDASSYSSVRFSMRVLENMFVKFDAVAGKAANSQAAIHFSGETIIQSKDRKYSIIKDGDSCYLHDRAKDSFYVFSPADTGFKPLIAKRPAKNNKVTKRFGDEDYNSTKEKAQVLKAIAVTNDFTHLIYSSNDVVRILDITHITSSNEKALVELKEQSGEVSCIAVSPDDKWILTAGNGTTARIWNFEGEEVAVLQGHQNKIAHAAFSHDGKEIITADENGRVFTWKLDKNIQPKDLAKFSPFNYHSLGLDEPKYNVSRIYDTAGSGKMLTAAQHYASSLPSTNLYPGDINFSTSLYKSINEIEDMYESVFRTDSFHKIREDYRNMVYKKYSDLIFSSPDLVKSKTGLDSIAKRRLYNYSDLRIRTLLQQKAYAYNAIGIIETELESAARYFLRFKNYHEANKYFGKKIHLYKSIINGDTSKAEGFKKRLSEAYISLAFYKLFERDFTGAIDASNSALKYDPGNAITYTNMAAGYLLNKQYKEAESYYYKKYNEDLYFSFLDDFEKLEKEKIITQSDTELYKTVTKIKRNLAELQAHK